MFLDSSLCAFTIVCVSKPRFTSVVQKIDAQAIEEFYGLTSDISKNSESGYILFYQSREWLELDHSHRMRLNRMKPCFFIYLQPNRPRVLPFLFHLAPLIRVGLLWHMCQLSVLVSASGLTCASSVICFLSLSHLHLDCTLKQKQTCSTAWQTLQGVYVHIRPHTLGVDYQEHGLKKGLVHIQTDDINRTVSCVCI